MLYPTGSIELPLSSIGSRRLREDVFSEDRESGKAPQVPHLVMCSNERGNGRLPRRSEIEQGPPGQLLLEVVS